LVERQAVAVFRSPYLENLANSFTVWLTRRVNGRLPAPHIHILGSSEQCWPFLRAPSIAANPATTEKSWETCDACTFMFMAAGPGGEVVRLDRKAKRGILPAFFPFQRRQIRKLARYDAAIFLRLACMPDPQRQIFVMCEECVRVVELWVARPLTAGSPEDGPDPQVAAWLNEFAEERHRKKGGTM
jgi:hypothetical protein